MKPIIQVEDVNKSFVLSKDNINHVLHNVNATILEGDYVSVMGSSGSGKSTLLYSISGMDNIDSGVVTFQDMDVSHVTDEVASTTRLKKMGFVFQQSHLLKDLTIYENIVLPGYMNKSNTKQEVDERAHQLLSQLGIEAIANNRINEASGGQLQRVSIARAMINNPDILFGDEPTGALNSSATKDVLQIFDDINNNGTTVFLVTHDAKVACRSNRVLFMEDGTIKDELVLGSYRDETNQKTRQERLDQWLRSHRF